MCHRSPSPGAPPAFGYPPRSSRGGFLHRFIDHLTGHRQGFKQSPLLASLALWRPAVASSIEEAAEWDVFVSVYFDDLASASHVFYVPNPAHVTDQRGDCAREPKKSQKQNAPRLERLKPL
jgi:hypothetical protein